MLKTWKEPVPGSMDPRPVFPAEVTRTIENALIKARTAAVQLQTRNRTPLNMPGRPMSTSYRNTPTPPHNASQFQPPPQDAYQNGFRSQQVSINTSLLSFDTTNMFKPTPQQFSSHQLPPDIARSLSAVLNPQDDLNKLKADIHGLIAGFQSEFARNPYDSQVQTKLKALLDLQAVVQSQQLNLDAIGMIKKQVAQLQAVQSQPNPPPSAAPQQSQWQAPTPVALPFQPPPPTPQGFAPTPSAQPPVAPPAFAPGILEQLLASTANGQKPSTPVVQAALRAMPPPPPTNRSPRTAAAIPAGPTGNPLLDALRAANILPASANATPVPASGLPVPPPAAPAPALSILQQLQGLAPKLSSTPMPPPGTPAKVRIPMNAAALKMYLSLHIVTPRYSANIPSSFRPEVVHTLYDAQPNQCTTCGRRFLSTDEGRAQKARHLDWHFRSNQRIADAALAAGLTRSWYIDEMEWIRLREVDASSAAADMTSATTTTSKPVSVREKYIPAPTGAAANATCPICQEKFEPEWHEDAQEWVWMDAVKVGGRVFHASCHDEVKRASGGDRGRSTTPDAAGVLGKRKAEADLANLKTKLKREVAA
jgi:pre-mRNA cleavage complex 2 protein Pcf11